jgi:hypothetical protein
VTQTIVELSGSGNWEVPEGVTHADLFLVGGGGGGNAGGGGGGYTGTWLNVKLDDVPGYDNGSIPYSVGQGGAGVTGNNNGPSTGQSGGKTRFGSDDTYEVDGGLGAFTSSGNTVREGGDGGSGGGASGSTNQLIGAGGSDGSNGGAGQRGDGGVGQGTTTRAFGDPEGEIYAGGGGGGDAGSGGQPGGDGGGGDGGSNGGAGQDGEDGKGGGGGGHGGIFSATAEPGRGGHGTILIAYTIGETSTGETTGTGTTSTGPAARLTPLNLFLVTLRLPDEPVEDPEPEPAEPGIVPPDIGEFWPEQGGWLGAYISLTENGVPTHALVMADAAAAGSSIQNFGAINNSATSLIDGPGNFALLLQNTQPAGSLVAQIDALNGSSHAGFSDWYMPAFGEMIALYSELKPETTETFTGAGAVSSPWAVPPVVNGQVSGSPITQTAITAFQAGQPQALDHTGGTEVSLFGPYATSTHSQGGHRRISARNLLFTTGAQSTVSSRVRAIRRVPVTWTIP